MHSVAAALDEVEQFAGEGRPVQSAKHCSALTRRQRHRHSTLFSAARDHHAGLSVCRTSSRNCLLVLLRARLLAHAVDAIINSVVMRAIHVHISDVLGFLQFFLVKVLRI